MRFLTDYGIFYKILRPDLAGGVSDVHLKPSPRPTQTSRTVIRLFSGEVQLLSRRVLNPELIVRLDSGENCFYKITRDICNK